MFSDSLTIVDDGLLLIGKIRDYKREIFVIFYLIGIIISRVDSAKRIFLFGVFLPSNSLAEWFLPDKCRRF